MADFGNDRVQVYGSELVPKGATMVETIEQVRSRDPVPPSRTRPKLAHDLETICLKCLEKDPRSRYSSCLEFVRALIGEGLPTAVHDVSDGGLLVAVAEMALASGIGVRLYGEPMGMAAHAFWFGEDQARYVMTVKRSDAEAIVARCKSADIPVRRIGSTAGNTLTLPGQRPLPLTTLAERFEGFLPRYMAGAA